MSPFSKLDPCVAAPESGPAARSSLALGHRER